MTIDYPETNLSFCCLLARISTRRRCLRLLVRRKLMKPAILVEGLTLDGLVFKTLTGSDLMRLINCLPSPRSVHSAFVCFDDRWQG